MSRVPPAADTKRDGRLRLFICHHQPLAHLGLRQFLRASCPDIDLVGTSTSWEELVSRLAGCEPRVVVASAACLGPDPLTDLGVLSSNAPTVACVVLGDGEADFAYQALASGACGLVGEDCRPEELVEVARLVARGYAVVARDTLRAVVHVAEDREIIDLTDDAREVAAALLRGDSRDQILANLGISERTLRRRLEALATSLHISLGDGRRHGG